VTAAAAGLAACVCELGRARRHLERAIAELEQARLAWGVWADGVRKLAEQRTGISIAGGFGLLDDEGYAAALRVGVATALLAAAAPGRPRCSLTGANLTDSTLVGANLLGARWPETCQSRRAGNWTPPPAGRGGRASGPGRQKEPDQRGSWYIRTGVQASGRMEPGCTGRRGGKAWQ
jgi:Pentapeptide repeats (8 copies)